MRTEDERDLGAGPRRSRAAPDAQPGCVSLRSATPGNRGKMVFCLRVVWTRVENAVLRPEAARRVPPALGQGAAPSGPRPPASPGTAGGPCVRRGKGIQFLRQQAAWSLDPGDVATH